MSTMYNYDDQNLLKYILRHDPGPNQFDYVKRCMVQHLIDTGYPDYAAILYRFDFIIDYSPYRAWIDNRCRIAINAKLFIAMDTNSTCALRADWRDIASLFIRHEILHRLLKHVTRERKYCAAHADKNIDETAMMYAKDIEVSNYYSLDDVNVWNHNPDLFFGGLVVYPCFNTAPIAMFPQYQGKPFEQVYEMLMADMHEQQGSGDSDKSDKQDSSEQDDDSGQNSDNSEQNQQDQDSGSGEQESDEQDKTDLSQSGSGEYDELDSDENKQNPTKYNPESIKQLENIPHHQNNSDDLPVHDNIQEKMLESVGMRKADNQERMQHIQGGPGDYSATDNTYVDQEDIDRNIMQSSLHYDLSMYFGGASRYNRHGTFARPNKKYSDSDIIRKTRVMRPKDESKLALYIDRSGSFDDSKTIAAQSVFEKLKSIRNLDLEVFYFGSHVVSERDYMQRRSTGGGTDYGNVFRHIKEYGFRNVAIISDSDACNECAFPECVESVWYCYVRETDMHNTAANIARVCGICTPPCLYVGLMDVKPSVRVAIWTVDVVGQFKYHNGNIHYRTYPGLTRGAVNRVGVSTAEYWKDDLIPALNQQVYYHAPNVN